MLVALTATPAAEAQMRFEDATAGAGTVRSGESWGSSWNDYNGDGWQDLFLSSHRGTPRFYRNNANGTFTDVAARVLPDAGWFLDPLADTHSAAFGDIDNDGDDDFYWARWTPPQTGGNSDLLVNEDGVFWALGMPDRATGRAAALFDWSRDGLLDYTVLSSGRLQMFRQLPRQGLAFLDDLGTGVQCSTPGYKDHALLLDVNGNGSLDLVCASSAAFPIGAFDTSTRPFTDIKASVPSTANVVETVAADFNADLKNDILLLRGKLRASGATQITPNRIESWLDGLASADAKGFRFASPGPVSVTVDYNRLGPNGKPETLVLSPFGPTSGSAGWIDAGYDRWTGEWVVSMKRAGASNRRAYIIVETEQPAARLRTFGLTTPEGPLSARLISSSPSGLRFDFAAGLNDPVSCVSAVAGDFDNDMDQDIYMVCSSGVDNLPNRLYENLGNGTFKLISSGAGARGPVGAGLKKGVGVGESVSMADYDNDGFPDLFVMNGLMMRPWGVGGFDLLLRNSSAAAGNANHWLQIDLKGKTSNRDGIGARVYVTAGGKTQYREQAGGYHRFVQNSRRLHFGLAGNRTAQVKIFWPSGRIDTFNGVTADGIYAANEGGSLVRTPLRPPKPPTGAACGAPDLDRSPRKGIFVWKDCATGTWSVRVTDGGQPMRYEGRVSVPQTVRKLKGFSVESNDKLTLSQRTRIEYSMLVGGGGRDGFDFLPKSEAGACLRAQSPAGAKVYLGPKRKPIGESINLRTLQRCN